MTQANNIGHAALILGCLYFLLNYHLDLLTNMVLGSLVLFALISWTQVSSNKEYLKETRELYIEEKKLDIRIKELEIKKLEKSIR